MLGNQWILSVGINEYCIHLNTKRSDLQLIIQPETARAAILRIKSRTRFPVSCMGMEGASPPRHPNTCQPLLVTRPRTSRSVLLYPWSSWCNLQRSQTADRWESVCNEFSIIFFKHTQAKRGCLSPFNTGNKMHLEMSSHGQNTFLMLFASGWICLS